MWIKYSKIVELIELAFSYIKYDLTKMVGYFDFIFAREYMDGKDDVNAKEISIVSVGIMRIIYLQVRLWICWN